MSAWANLTTDERETQLRDMARSGMTEVQIEALLGAPNGSIRTMARRLEIILRSERQRKAAEASGDLGATTHGSMWVVDENRRRAMVARKASKGASEALRAFR